MTPWDNRIAHECSHTPLLRYCVLPTSHRNLPLLMRIHLSTSCFGAHLLVGILWPSYVFIIQNWIFSPTFHFSVWAQNLKCSRYLIVVTILSQYSGPPQLHYALLSGFTPN